MENFHRKDEQKGKRTEFVLLLLPSDHLSTFMVSFAIFSPKSISLKGDSEVGLEKS